MKLAKIRNEILTNVSQKICRIVRPEIRYQLLDHTTKVENIIIHIINDVDFQLCRTLFKNDSLLKDLYN